MASGKKESGDSIPVHNDEEYKDAVKPIVDDHMRTDRLGPHIVKVLREHTPTSKEVVALIAREVIKDPTLKKALKEVIDERNRENKMQYFSAAIGAFSTILLALIIWGIEYALTHKI